MSSSEVFYKTYYKKKHLLRRSKSNALWSLVIAGDLGGVVVLCMKHKFTIRSQENSKSCNIEKLEEYCIFSLVNDQDIQFLTIYVSDNVLCVCFHLCNDTRDRYTVIVTPLLVHAQRMLLERIKSFGGPSVPQPHHVNTQKATGKEVAQTHTQKRTHEA